MRKGSRIVVASLAGVILFLGGGCRSTRQSIAPDDTFFAPLTALPRPVETKPPMTAVSTEHHSTTGEADSLLNSQRDLERRIGALAVQLDRLEAARRGARSDSAKPVRRAIPPAVAPQPLLVQVGNESINEAERLYASKEYRKTIQSCQDALDRGAAKGMEDRYTFLIGASHYRLKQFDLALVSLKKVLEVKHSSQRAEASFLMGLTYRQLGMRERAATMFEAALKEGPDDDLARSIRLELDRSAKNR